MVNTKNVHRTNFLLGHPYGTDFVYDEMMIAPGFGEIARVTTQTFATMVSLLASGGLNPEQARATAIRATARPAKTSRPIDAAGSTRWLPFPCQPVRKY